MRGKILGYVPGDQEGAIHGTDGNRYAFSLTEWKGSGMPQPETPVDFVPNEGRALKIFPIQDRDREENKLALGIISLVVTFFLGFIGTLISRLALSRQPFSSVVVPVLIHAIITAFFFVPFVGWIVYLVCTVYFMVKNYQLVNKSV